MHRVRTRVGPSGRGLVGLVSASSCQSRTEKLVHRMKRSVDLVPAVVLGGCAWLRAVKAMKQGFWVVEEKGVKFEEKTRDPIFSYHVKQFVGRKGIAPILLID